MTDTDIDIRIMSPAEVEPDMLPALLDYDRPFFPAPRARFLETWLTRKETRRSWALVDPAVDAGGGPGRVTGYGTVRQCRAGWKIGPLFADDPAGAEVLFRRLASCAGNDPVILDLPEPNPAALDLAKAYGLSPVFETARMYRGTAPSLPIDRIYGVTTFELV